MPGERCREYRRQRIVKDSCGSSKTDFECLLSCKRGNSEMNFDDSFHEKSINISKNRKNKMIVKEKGRKNYEKICMSGMWICS